MFLVEDSQMSLMNEHQLVFHSYLTICTSTELHLERMLCMDLLNCSAELYCRIRSTM